MLNYTIDRYISLVMESIHKLDEEKLRKYEVAKALINQLIDKNKSLQTVCSDAVEVKDVYNDSEWVRYVFSFYFQHDIMMSFV